MIKKIIKKYFESFAYFYSYLKYRIFVVVLLTIMVGILDGFGLTMFLPLLHMVSGTSEMDPESLGKLSFLIEFIENSGLPFSIVTVLAFMAIFFILKGVFQYLTAAYRIKVRERFIENLRMQNIRGLNRLAYKYFVMSDVGRIQNTLTGEVDRVAQSFLNYFTSLQYGIMVAVYMGFAFSIDAKFAILVTIGGVLTNFLFKKLYKHTRGASRKLTGENNIFQGLIIQNVGNYKYLKATGTLSKYGEKLERSVLKIKQSNIKIGELDAIMASAREPLLIAVVVLVIYIQTTFLGSKLGPILVSLLFFYRALSYLMQMQVRWNKFLSVSGSLENMALFGRELKANREEKGEQSLVSQIEELKLEEVSFYYNDTRVLKNISLAIKKNETIAFVGESGSGKTTLVNIIAGLLPINKGKYLINDVSCRNLHLKSLQDKIGYITQDPVIFNDTLYNNVTFWGEKNDSNLQKFWKAVEQAALFDFISKLPHKEETVFENNGSNLSGGQRQRISIARELFKDIEILILDEATSALDSETEKAIQRNIDSLKGDYTILIVAHRISTIKNADKIVVMKNGEISNVANFDQLVNESKYFKKLVELQEI